MKNFFGWNRTTEPEMVAERPIPDVEIPEQSLPAFVLGDRREHGHELAFVDGSTGRELTVGALTTQVDGVAAGLAGRGVEPGDVFAIYAPNVPEYAVAFHGVTSIGGVVTPLNPRSTTEEVTRQLRETEARHLLTVPALLDTALEAAERTAIEDVFVLGDAPSGTPFSTLVDSDNPTPTVEVDPDDLAVIPYSSGTTGLPKGVELSHRNLVANVAQLSAVRPAEFTADDVTVGVLPFYHIYGMTVIMNQGLKAGTTVVTMPAFDLEPFLEILARRGVTTAYLVPPIILALANAPVVEDYDLSALEVITSGAAPLSTDVAAACADRLDCLVKQGYGLTEASPVTHLTPREPDRVRRGAVGPALPNTECQIVDVETREPLGPGEKGEVLVRGPQVMRGYHGRPAATGAAFENEAAQTDSGGAEIDGGWLRTGDLGVLDAEGYLTVVDRVKELIKYKGHQVAPAELERRLLNQPTIDDAAVVPKPDERAGEIPKALVVPDGDVDPEAVKDAIAERVAPHKRVREVDVVAEIPRSASGKIQRRELIEKHVQDQP
jgi:acyl-CoA synthetase (AMP-forming)/AMP-acid ligase II